MKRLAYSDTDGFTLASVTEKSLAEAGSSDHALVSASTTLSESKTVASIHCSNNSVLNIPSGTTLTVGDGAGSALVWMDATPKASNAKVAIEGQGTLAFGNAMGRFAFSNCDTGAILTNHINITGSSGVAFVSTDSNVDRYVSVLCDQNTVAPGWTGPTVLSRVQLKVNREDGNTAGLQNPFPQTGDDNDVYLDRAQFYIRPRKDSYTFSNRFHLNGVLVGGSGLYASSIYCQTVGGGKYSFNGEIEVLSDSTIAAARDHTGCAASVLTFNAPITGPGALTFLGKSSDAAAGGMVNVKAASTATGDLTADNISVQFISPGAPGTGKLITKNSGKFMFQGHANLTVPGDVNVNKMIINGSQITFTGSGRIDTLILESGAKVTLGEGISFGTVKTDCDCLLIAGTGSQQVWNDAGVTNVLNRGVISVTNAGQRIESGTVRLAADRFAGSDVSYWLDASQEDTILRDENGGVIRWMSANGNGYYFTNRCIGTSNKQRARPAYGREERKINGMNTVSFDGADEKYHTDDNPAMGVMGDSAVRHRTVFMVIWTRAYTTWGAPFGKDSSDYGLRMMGSGPWETRSNVATHLFAQKGLIVNGVNTTQNPKDKASVIVMEHTNDTVTVWGDSPSEFTPSLGAYYPSLDSASYWRAFDGDIAEVIAYNRLLSENDRKRIENYLAKKWGVSDELYQNVPESSGGDFMPPETALAVDGEGTLDLNGQDLAVAELSGLGTICNTGTNAATLCVTGACTFAGTVATNVTLAPPAGSTLSSKFETGTTLALADGTTTLYRHVTGIPTNGISMWVDASKSGTVETNDEGLVTKWYWRNDGTKYFYTESSTTTGGGVKGDMRKPTYLATGLNGKPTLFFDEYGNLSASANLLPRTLFMVGKLDSTQYVNHGLWGLGSTINGSLYGGIRINTNNKTDVAVTYPDPYAPLGDTLRVNGVDKTGAVTVDFGSSVYRFTHRSSTDTDMVSGKWKINAFNNNGGARQYVSEIIAYDRRLGDDEILQVEAYLKAKWIDGTVTSETVNDIAPIADGGTTLKAPESGTATVIPMNFALSLGLIEWTVKGSGETAELPQIVVNGSAELANNAYAQINDFENLCRRHSIGYLCLRLATGYLFGEFSGSNLDGSKRWRFESRSGNTFDWYVTPVGSGTVLLLY